MGDSLATEMRTARAARGWDQAELARVLGVGQQTVSRWEHGATAPTGERLAHLRAVLGLDDAPTPPRRPLLEELPFNRLDAHQFEAFCAALAARLYPDAQEVIRYGVSGDAQHGIDIRVVTADGERIGLQCKKYGKFHPRSFHKAVAELDRVRARVDRCVLFLSTRASAAVMQACDDLDEWSIRDSRTLSREVARLPVDEAVSLLDRFFPDMREEFLGVRTPSIWHTTAEAFPASLPSPVYSHTFALVGRQETLEAMTVFAAAHDDGRPGVAVVSGTAGQGKSRLLYELAHENDRRPGTATRVLLPGPVSAEDFERLPTSVRLLVLVEDAHERSDDLAMVVSGIFRARPHARVVLATRPYGSHVVQDALRAARVDEREVSRWDLAALRPEEARALAAEVLGEGREHAARVVAHVTADSPLLLVNAASAVRRGDLAVSALQSDPDVHRLLRDVFVRSALSKSPRPDDDRALLRAVAALQPVATDTPHFQQALSGILRMPFSRISPQLHRLEGTGILMRRRGTSVRIFPDLLGDVLLAEAALNPHDGSPTGYLELVRECAGGAALANALVNAGRVDWQWNGRSPHHRGVLDPLWDVFETTFKSGGAHTRAELLRLLRKVAPFQPERVFALAQWALDNPAAEDDRPEETRWMPGEYGQADVLREVPHVLEAVAVDLDRLRSVYDLLWSMGRDDQRPPHRHPDAPLRVLLDLASYKPGKPLAYQEILLDAVSTWLERTAPDTANRMPLALLDPLFSATAESRTIDGWTLTFRRHPLRADAVAPVRKRATEILLGQYVTGEERRAVPAAATFAEALRHQTEDFESYNVDFLRELRLRVTGNRPTPLVSLATRRSLSWTVNHGPAPLREAAQAVLDSLPDGLEHRLAVLLHTGTYDTGLVPRSGTGTAVDIEHAQRYWETLCRNTTDLLRNQPADRAAALLASSVAAGHRFLDRHSEGIRGVVHAALTVIPELITALLAELAHADDNTVRAMLPTVLQVSFDQDATGTLDICRRLIAGNRSADVWAVSQALHASMPRAAVPKTGALDIARALANHPDPTVGARVLDMAVSLLPTAKEAALELLSTVPFGTTGAIAHQLWWAFTTDRMLSWRELPPPLREFLLEQLTVLPSLEDHTLQQFIAHLTQSDPAAALSLLRSRVELWESGAADEHFEPLPFEWSAPLPFSESPARPDLLRSVRDWLGEPRPSAWRRELHAAEIYWTVADPADESALGLLLEPYQEGESGLAHAVTPLLSKIPQDIVWDQVSFVTALLNAASRLSEDLFRRTGSSLHAAVFSGVRSRPLGEPYREDIEVKERAERVRAGLSRGSAVDLFYKSLLETAQHNMDRAVAEDMADRWPV
ncbi:helix-turn-helix domain-containing protein [Streptomyces xinghaiensis]|uniref:helix-turn-helix domain-containing protein n=1 Tax=Streptomyces xinghaiensis TaxID=1038928 RepID=UPI00378D8CBB